MNRLVLLFALAALASTAGCGDEVRKTRTNVTREPASSDSDAPRYTHVITRDADYYSTAPLQSQPADGKMAGGTKVVVLQRAGTYVRVEAEKGTRGYVEATAVKEISDHVDRQHEIPKH